MQTPTLPVARRSPGRRGRRPARGGRGCGGPSESKSGSYGGRIAPPGMPKTVSAPTCSSDLTSACAPVSGSAVTSSSTIRLSLPTMGFPIVSGSAPCLGPPGPGPPGGQAKNPRCRKADEGARRCGSTQPTRWLTTRSDAVRTRSTIAPADPRSTILRGSVLTFGRTLGCPRMTSPGPRRRSRSAPACEAGLLGYAARAIAASAARSAEDRLVDRHRKAEGEPRFRHRIASGRRACSRDVPAPRSSPDLLEVVRSGSPPPGSGPTHRRSGRRLQIVSGPFPAAVERFRGRRRQIPGPLLPAHGRWIRARAAQPPTARPRECPDCPPLSSRGRRPARPRPRRGVGQRLPGHGLGPAHPPALRSTVVGRAEGRQPEPGQIRRCGPLVQLAEPAGQPAVGRGVPVRAVHPAASGLAAQDLTLETEQGDNARVGRDP